ncbi:MAG: cardiolipin synthase [Candidatus Hepatoplasma vulgare]|nr:MAG: cardiolipin synthase [Candidatus Hepatoplasma sp.]
MNKKILSFFLVVLIVLFFCLLALYLLYLIEEWSIIAIVVIFVIFYLLAAFFLYDLYSKNHTSKQSKITWTIVLIFIPFFGVLFYYLAGYTNFKIKKKLKKLFILESEIAEGNSYSEPKEIILPFVNENLNFQNRKIITNSDFIIYNNGSKKFNALINDFKNAKSFINIQYFIINNGIVWKKIEEILLKKAKEGIKINILTDYFGSVQTKDSTFDLIRKEKNIKFKIVNPTKTFLSGGHLNFRAHNKFVIIDNKIVYFGGMNLGDDYVNLYPKYGAWLDLQIAFKGEIVNEMNNHFINQWYFWTGEKLEKAKLTKVKRETNIQFFSDGPNFEESSFLNYFLKLIKISKKQIKIVTPYVVFPREIFDELRKAKKRGVEIELITAGRADKKTAYEIGKIHLRRLLNIGVKVYRMDNMFIHSKFFLFDDNNLITGTTNLDYRAIYLHFESNLFIHDENIYSSLNNVFNLYKEHAMKIEIHEYNNIFYSLKAPIYYFLSPMF